MKIKDTSHPKYLKTFENKTIFVQDTENTECKYRFTFDDYIEYKDEFQHLVIINQSGDYTFIGDEIVELKCDCKFVKLGNDECVGKVLFPYAVDEKGNYYLLSIRIKILAGFYHGDSPHYYYFTNASIVNHVGDIPTEYPDLKLFREIISNRIQTNKNVDINGMAYTFILEKEYKYHTEETNVIKSKNRDNYILTKNKYLKIMQQFGQLKGFEIMKFGLIKVQYF